MVESLAEFAPADLIRSWTIQGMPRPMWHQRAKSNAIPSSEAFLWASYRSGLTSDSTYLLLTGFNGNVRNPYHTFAIHTLRIGGDRLLNGYNNGVVTKIDGVLDSHVPQDAGLTATGRIGSTVFAEAFVPNMTGSNWSRTVVIHDDRYMISVDSFDITTAATDFSIETSWDPTHGEWDDTRGLIQITPDVDEVEEATSYQLRSASPVTVRDRTHDEIRESVSGEELDSEHILSWNRSVEPGDTLVNVHSITPSHADGTAQKISCSAAALSLPEGAIVTSGEYLSTSGNVAVIASTHLFGHDVTQVGLESPLLTSSGPIDVEWNFETATLELQCTESETVQLSPEYVQSLSALNPEGQSEPGLLELSASTHEFSDVHPTQQFIDEVHQVTAPAKDSPGPKTGTHSDSSFAPRLPRTSLTPQFSTSFSERCAAISVIQRKNGKLLAVSAGASVHLIDETGTTVRQISGSSPVQELHWWDRHDLLLIGREDDTVSAFSINRDEPAWTFDSHMAPAVQERGKQYWYRTAPGHGGIHGLSSGTFLDQSEQVFIGSACTVEIVNKSGSLLDRKPVFWGPVHAFETIQKADNERRLLMIQRPTDSPEITYLDSDDMEVKDGYDTLPSEHTVIESWGVSARGHLRVADRGSDGEEVVISDTTGKWNQVSSWSTQGEPLGNVHLGPGKPTSFHIHSRAEADAAERARYIRSLESLRDESGEPLVVIGTNAKTLIGLSAMCDVEWVCDLPSIPTAITSMAVDDRAEVIGVGCESGEVVVVNADGTPFAQIHQPEAPAFLASVWAQFVTVSRSGTVNCVSMPE